MLSTGWSIYHLVSISAVVVRCATSIAWFTQNILVAYVGIEENNADERQRGHQFRRRLRNDAIALVCKANVSRDLDGVHLVHPVQRQDQIGANQLRLGSIKASGKKQKRNI